MVLLYLESFGNPRRFARIARRCPARNRSSPQGGTHRPLDRARPRAIPRRLAANDAVVLELFRQSGVIRADTIDEMMDIAACLDLQPLPNGKRVAIVTNAGGPGILAVDACEVANLSLATLDAATRARLASGVAGGGQLRQPG